MNEHQLLGKWISQLLLNHFLEEKKNLTEKLFIKINGLTLTDFTYVLRFLENNL